MRPACSVNQFPSAGSAYPLLSPSDDVAGVFADFYLWHAAPAAYPLRLHLLKGFGTTPSSPHARDLVVKDAAGATVLDTSAADYHERAWGSDRVLCEWASAAAVCRCVLYTAALTSPSATLSPADGRLDPRGCVAGVRGLRSITVGGHTLTGDVVLAPGHNVRVEASDAVRGLAVAVPSARVPGRPRSTLAFHAEPGAGLGTVVRCDDDPPVRRLGGAVAGPGGNVTLDLGGCLRTQRPYTEQGLPGDRAYALELANALSLHNDCDGCCSCGKYARVYKGLSRLWDSGRGLAARSQGVARALGRVKARVDDARECRLAGPLRLVLYPTSGYQLGVGVSFCNSAGGCVTPATLRLSFMAALGEADRTAAVGGRLSAPVYVDVGTAAGERRYVPDGSWPVYDVHAERVEPRAVLTVRTRVVLPLAAPGTVVTVMATLHSTTTLNLPPQAPPSPAFEALWGSAGAPVDVPWRVGAVAAAAVRFGNTYTGV